MNLQPGVVLDWHDLSPSLKDLLSEGGLKELVLNHPLILCQKSMSTPFYLEASIFSEFVKRLWICG